MPTLFAVYFLPVNYSGCRKDMLLIKSIKAKTSTRMRLWEWIITNYPPLHFFSQQKTM